jgi:hypothetical protein
MTTEEIDLTWQTLSELHGEVAPESDIALLRTCYSIQKKYQFGSDSSVPSTHMEDAINRYVDAWVQRSSGKEG